MKTTDAIGIPSHYRTEPLHSTTGEWAQFARHQRWTYLFVLFLIATSSYIDRGILSVLLEPIKHEFALSDRMVGLLGGAPFAIAYAISSLPLSRLADRTSRKWVLIPALVCWSAMTVVCGLATSLIFLLMSRIVVGAAEGGATPASHALTAEYFPPKLHAVAFGILSSANFIGVAVALAGGGWVAQAYGWRAAFIVLGAISGPIALLAMVVLKEPPRVARETTQKASFADDVKVLARKRSYLFTVLGFIVLAVFANGVTIFIPTYMVRSMGLNLAQVGAAYASAATIGSLIGTVAGGILGDRLARRGKRAFLVLPAIAVTLLLPITLVTFWVSSLLTFLALASAMIALTYGTLPPLYAAIQSVCGPSRRATASAIMLATSNALGLTLGSLLTGVLSDFYSGAGSASLRYAILTMTAVLPCAALLFHLGSRSLETDVE